jgi:hypothetical protein
LYPPALTEPARDARHGFPHLLGGTRIGETNKGAAVHRIEIDARVAATRAFSSIWLANSKLSEVNFETSA